MLKVAWTMSPLFLTTAGLIMVVALAELTTWGSISLMHVGRVSPSRGMNSVPGTSSDEYTTISMFSARGSPQIQGPSKEWYLGCVKSSPDSLWNSRNIETILFQGPFLTRDCLHLLGSVEPKQKFWPSAEVLVINPKVWFLTRRFGK